MLVNDKFSAHSSSLQTCWVSRHQHGHNVGSFINTQPTLPCLTSKPISISLNLLTLDSLLIRPPNRLAEASNYNFSRNSFIISLSLYLIYIFLCLKCFTLIVLIMRYKSKRHKHIDHNKTKLISRVEVKTIAPETISMKLLQPFYLSPSRDINNRHVCLEVIWGCEKLILREVPLNLDDVIQF